jgi:hypothetical protein
LFIEVLLEVFLKLLGQVIAASVSGWN